MGSPFPGMDPYLEGDLWQEFHGRLASAISAQLMPKIAPKYVAMLARRFVITRPTIGISYRHERRANEVWTLPLRKRLKTVPVPLLPNDHDVPLDLQAAVDACFALVGYERLLAYDEPPPLPELPHDDLAWVEVKLCEAGYRARP